MKQTAILLLFVAIMSSCNNKLQKGYAKPYTDGLSESTAKKFSDLKRTYDVTDIQSGAIINEIKKDSLTWIYFIDPSCKGQVSDIKKILTLVAQNQEKFRFYLVFDYPRLTEDNLAFLRKELHYDGDMYCLTDIDHYQLVKKIKKEYDRYNKVPVREYYTNYIFREMELKFIGYTYDISELAITQATKK